MNSMLIQRGLVKYKDRSDIICTYGISQDGTKYYFIDGNKLENNNIIVTTVLLEAVDPLAVSSHIGVIDSDGNIVIPCVNKSIKSISNDILLVETSNPTTESVLESIRLKDDSLAATRLVTTPATIKDKMNTVMNNNGRFIFNDQFSEATIFDINGQNLINNEYYSFIGMTDDKIYFSKNTIDSEIVEYALYPVNQSNLNVENTTTTNNSLKKSIYEEQNLDSSVDNTNVDVYSEDSTIPVDYNSALNENNNINSFSYNDSSINNSSIDNSTYTENFNKVVPNGFEDAPVTYEENSDVNSEFNNSIDNSSGISDLFTNETMPYNEEYINNAHLEGRDDINNEVSNMEETSFKNVNNILDDIESVNSNNDLVTKDKNVEQQDDNEMVENDMNSQLNSVHNSIDSKNENEQYLENKTFDKKINNNELSSISRLDDAYEEDIDLDVNNYSENNNSNNGLENIYNQDSLVSSNSDSYEDGFNYDFDDNGVDNLLDNYSYNSTSVNSPKRNLMDDVTATISNLIELNQNQQAMIDDYEIKLAKCASSRKKYLELSKSQAREITNLNNKITKLESEIQSLERKIESLSPSSQGDLARVMADAQNILGRTQSRVRRRFNSYN